MEADYEHANTNNTIQNHGSALILTGLWQNNITAFVIVSFCFAILVIGGIFLNSLVVFLMIKSKRHRRSISNLLITHLSVVDLIFRVVCIPPLVYLSIPSTNSHDSVVCKIATFVLHVCGAAIFASLVVIGVDRYRNIVHPLMSLKKKTKPSQVIGLVWGYSAVASATLIYTAGLVPLSDLAEGKGISAAKGSTSCNITPGLLGGLSVTIYSLLTFLIPMTTLVFAYTSIWTSLRKRSKSGQVAKAAVRSKAKAVRMLVIVVSSFVVCWGPSVAMECLRSYGLLMDIRINVLAVATLITTMLQLCSSLANPLIYAFYNSGFKKDLADVLFCHCCSSTQLKDIKSSRDTEAKKTDSTTF